MKLGGRISAAIEVLTEMETRHRPASEALKDWGTSHRFAGSSDRGVIGNMVYDALRWRLSGAWIAGGDAPRGVVLATIARRWGLGVAGLVAALGDDPHAPDALSDAETARIGSADFADAPLHVRADVPEWVAPRLQGTFGGDWVEEGAALAGRPPLDMRANALKADRAKVLKQLAKFAAVAAPFAADGMRIAPTRNEERHPNVEVEPAFQKGWFEVQDEGSQLAAAMTGARGGEQVLDLCAGAGGKTLALAAMMGNRGQILATDSDRSRLAPIFDRLKRAGVRNVQVRPAGASLDDLAGRMDVVLIDAPCTGTGTWRRRPDAKWRVSERALAERVTQQAALLDVGQRFVKSGGRLVYVTCSILPEENGDQVAGFVERHTEFVPLSGQEVVAATAVVDDKRPALAAAALLTQMGVVLSPRRTATDGFFVSVLRRQMSAP
jgi:16S rRNA (cytosine967-C5)-methyltransferase